MRIAVTGSTGLIGTALVAALRDGGHQVIRLVRRTPARHVRPRQLDGGVEAVQGAGGEPAGGREGVPGDLVLAGRRPADQPDHPVAAVAQGSHQGGPDQAR